MGVSIRPRYPFILLLLIGCLQAHAYQIVPDDIAFKPAAETPSEAIAAPTSDTPNPPNAHEQNDSEPPITLNPDVKVGDQAVIEQATIVTEPAAPIKLEAAAAPTETKPISSSCKTHNQWQKTISIMAMPRLIPNQSNAGNFYQAETYIPQLLAQELKEAIGAKSQLIPQQLAPQNENDTRQQVQTIAAQMGTQFVLSGEIVDMSMRDDTSVYSPGLIQRLRNHFTDITLMNFSDNRDRVFSLRLELRDGFTGEKLLTDTFQTKGIWKNPQPVGFHSPELWQSHYGRRIQRLIHQAGDHVAKNLQCQPYMARIDAHPGQTELILQGGANNGLQAGDQLKLYQLVVIASANHYGVFQTRLIKRDLHLHLKEVYPSHSLARLQGDDLLNGQYLAVGEE